MTARAALIVSLLALGCTEPPPVKPPVQPEPEPSASVAPPPPPFEPKSVVLDGKAMGTKIKMSAYTTPEMDEAKVGAALGKGFREITRLEKLMSTWIPSSEVSRINESGAKAPIVIGPETFAVIEKSIWISGESAGVFDITFEAMHGLWKFDEGAEPRVPDKKAIDKARKLIDYRNIEIDAAAHSVRLKKEGVRINLGGIAKGYAVDAAGKVLETEGLKGFFVQAGGDLYVRGKKPDGSRFRVGVRDPRGKNEWDSIALLEVEDHAFSTAGDYERAFVLDGKRYHHIIDPRTGYPATESRSVTVWAKDAFTADAIDDAVFILGPQKGLELVEKIDGAGAVVVDKNNKVWVSSRLTGVLQTLRPPSEGP